jgi:hypothetical protein
MASMTSKMTTRIHAATSTTKPRALASLPPEEASALRSWLERELPELAARLGGPKDEGR